MIFIGKSLLDTPMQIFIKLRHLVAEISRFKFDDYRLIRTWASDQKHFLGGVWFPTRPGEWFISKVSWMSLYDVQQTENITYML